MTKPPKKNFIRKLLSSLLSGISTSSVVVGVVVCVCVGVGVGVIEEKKVNLNFDCETFKHDKKHTKISIKTGIIRLCGNIIALSKLMIKMNSPYTPGPSDDIYDIVWKPDWAVWWIPRCDINRSLKDCKLSSKTQIPHRHQHAKRKGKGGLPLPA